MPPVVTQILVVPDQHRGTRRVRRRHGVEPQPPVGPRRRLRGDPGGLEHGLGLIRESVRRQPQPITLELVLAVVVGVGIDPLERPDPVAGFLIVIVQCQQARRLGISVPCAVPAAGKPREDAAFGDEDRQVLGQAVPPQHLLQPAVLLLHLVGRLVDGVEVLVVGDEVQPLVRVWVLGVGREEALEKLGHEGAVHRAPDPQRLVGLELGVDLPDRRHQRLIKVAVHLRGVAEALDLRLVGPLDPDQAGVALLVMLQATRQDLRVVVVAPGLDDALAVVDRGTADHHLLGDHRGAAEVVVPFRGEGIAVRLVVVVVQRVQPDAHDLLPPHRLAVQRQLVVPGEDRVAGPGVVTLAADKVRRGLVKVDPHRRRPIQLPDLACLLIGAAMLGLLDPIAHGRIELETRGPRHHLHHHQVLALLQRHAEDVVAR